MLKQAPVQLRAFQRHNRIHNLATALAIRYFTSQLNGVGSPPLLASTKNTAHSNTNQQKDNSDTRRPIWGSHDTWQILFTGLGAFVSVAGIAFYNWDRSKYSDNAKYKVIKNSMLHPIPVEPPTYPELSVKEQESVLKDIVFSNKASLVLVEGAPGSGKTTLVKKLLNERIARDRIPCYYWSLKAYSSIDFRDMFFQLFGIEEAFSRDIIKGTIGVATLMNMFRRLKSEHGVPCVLVVDDAQRLLLSDQGKQLALLLQECYQENLMTVIFIGSDGSSLGGFRQLSGYRARLTFRSLPPVPDERVKEYLMGPMHEHLKASGARRSFSEEMVDRVVSRFGGNFSDLRRFVSEVLEMEIFDEEAFLSRLVEEYEDLFKSVYANPGVRVVLDDLAKAGSIGLSNPYDIDALAELTRKNIIALHENKYTWNKRFVGIAYMRFSENRRAEELRERRKKAWYRFF